MHDQKVKFRNKNIGNGTRRVKSAGEVLVLVKLCENWQNCSIIKDSKGRKGLNVRKKVGYNRRVIDKKGDKKQRKSFFIELRANETRESK